MIAAVVLRFAVVVVWPVLIVMTMLAVVAGVVVLSLHVRNRRWEIEGQMIVEANREQPQ